MLKENIEGFFAETKNSLAGFLAGLQKKHENLEQFAMVSALLGVIFWLVSGLILEEIFFSFFLGAIFFLLVFAFLLLAEKEKAKKKARQAEAELPLALISIAAELNMNISFEKCLANSSLSGSRLSQEFKRVLREHREKGASLKEALLGFSERSNSLNVKRCVLQLVSALELGRPKKRGQAVKRIALEMLARQKAELKEYNGKLVVFSLVFVVVSAIVPAMFQSFVVVGSMVLSLSFSPEQVFYTIALVFPLVDLAVLLFTRSKSPVFLGDY